MKTIEEIMTLVDIAINEDEDGEPTFSHRQAIEADLRELVERKPLSDSEFSEMESECWSNTVDKGMTQFDFAELLKDKIEAHHKIGA